MKFLDGHPKIYWFVVRDDMVAIPVQFTNMRAVHTLLQVDYNKVQVAVRIKPGSNQANIVAASKSPHFIGQVDVAGRHSFKFTFATDSQPLSEFCQLVSDPLVENAIQGYNGCIITCGHSQAGASATA